MSDPGLDDLLATHIHDRLRITTSYKAIDESSVTSLAIGTPSCADGSIDLGGIVSATKAPG